MPPYRNICAGLLVHQSGLPVRHFIAACNANDVVHTYLQSGNYQPKPAIPTLSNAMDVGNPSNFFRILELFSHQFTSLKQKISSFSISDEATKQSIKQVYETQNYLLDPHGAVGYLSLKEYLRERRDQKGIFLATAHPVKFYDAIEPLIGKPIELPPSVLDLQGKKKISIKIETDFDSLKEILLNN